MSWDKIVKSWFTVYGKKVKGDLTPRERKEIALLIREIEKAIEAQGPLS